MKITGSLVEAFVFCPRQAWFLSRRLNGDQYNEFIAIGRLYAEKTYKRDKKEILIDGNKIDIIKENNNKFLFIETKKSSKVKRASEIQLLHYMYCFFKRGYRNIKGELRFPKERKVIEVNLNEAEILELERIYVNVNKLVNQDKPPLVKRSNICKECSYIEFCWA